MTSRATLSLLRASCNAMRLRLMHATDQKAATTVASTYEHIGEQELSETVKQNLYAFAQHKHFHHRMDAMFGSMIVVLSTAFFYIMNFEEDLDELDRPCFLYT